MKLRSFLLLVLIILACGATAMQGQAAIRKGTDITKSFDTILSRIPDGNVPGMPRYLWNPGDVYVIAYLGCASGSVVVIGRTDVDPRTLAAALESGSKGTVFESDVVWSDEDSTPAARVRYSKARIFSTQAETTYGMGRILIALKYAHLNPCVYARTPWYAQVSGAPITATTNPRYRRVVLEDIGGDGEVTVRGALPGLSLLAFVGVAVIPLIVVIFSLLSAINAGRDKRLSDAERFTAYNQRFARLKYVGVAYFFVFLSLAGSKYIVALADMWGGGTSSLIGSLLIAAGPLVLVVGFVGYSLGLAMLFPATTKGTSGLDEKAARNVAVKRLLLALVGGAAILALAAFVLPSLFPKAGNLGVLVFPGLMMIRVVWDGFGQYKKTTVRESRYKEGSPELRQQVESVARKVGCLAPRVLVGTSDMEWAGSWITADGKGSLVVSPTALEYLSTEELEYEITLKLLQKDAIRVSPAVFVVGILVAPVLFVAFLVLGAFHLGVFGRIAPFGMVFVSLWLLVRAVRLRSRHFIVQAMQLVNSGEVAVTSYAKSLQYNRTKDPYGYKDPYDDPKVQTKLNELMEAAQEAGFARPPDPRPVAG